MDDLNSIRVNLAELRREIAWLQQDNFQEIGLGDFLVFMRAYLHVDEKLTFTLDESKSLVAPTTQVVQSASRSRRK